MPRNDDPDLGNDVVLWRAVPRLQIETNPDGSESIQSWAFRQFPDNEISADIAAETTSERLAERFPPIDFRIAELTVADARDCGNVVCRDPEGGDQSHVLICPRAGKSRNRIYKDAARLARRSRLRPEAE